MAEQLNVPSVSLLQDLWWSLAFWDRSLRQQSNFNAESISLSLIHHLQDWDLSFELTAEPVLDEATDQFEFTPTFSIIVQWIPVPEIRSTISKDAETFSIDE